MTNLIYMPSTTESYKSPLFRSVACVVIEMETGKKPWDNFEYGQIWTKLKNGEKPVIDTSFRRELKVYI